jgi:hypothetical protein
MDALILLEEMEECARRRCSSDGCTNIAVKEGVCVRHGAKVKLCSIEGCANQSKQEEFAGSTGQRSHYAQLMDV